MEQTWPSLLSLFVISCLVDDSFDSLLTPSSLPRCSLLPCRSLRRLRWAWRKIRPSGIRPQLSPPVSPMPALVLVSRASHPPKSISPRRALSLATAAWAAEVAAAWASTAATAASIVTATPPTLLPLTPSRSHRPYRRAESRLISPTKMERATRALSTARMAASCAISARITESARPCIGNLKRVFEERWLF